MSNINQGYNYPLVFGVSEDITEAESVVVQLTHSNHMILRVWIKSQLAINATSDGKSVVIAPITQAESALWPPGRAWLDCSWILNGKPKHGIEKAQVTIRAMNDHAVQGDDDPIYVVDEEIDTSLLPTPTAVTTDILEAAIVVEVLGATDEQVKASAEAWLAEHADEVTGPQGEKGDKGDTGETGPSGSDATVTADNIKKALGYVPASDSDLSSLNNNILQLQESVDELEEDKIWTEDAGEAEDVDTPSTTGIPAGFISLIQTLFRGAVFNDEKISDPETTIAALSKYAASSSSISVSFSGGVLALSGFKSTPTISAT